jgi:hypothetical protein
MVLNIAHLRQDMISDGIGCHIKPQVETNNPHLAPSYLKSDDHQCDGGRVILALRTEH